jgi:hypothetical protein
MSAIEAPAVETPIPPKRRGPVAILAGVLLWPRSTFADLRDHGRWSWVWPVVLVAALAVAARLVALPIERARAEAMMAELQEQIQSEGSGDAIITFSGPAGGPVGMPMGAAVVGNPAVEAVLPVAGVVWDWLFRGGILTGLAWLMGGRPRFGAMLRMSGWTLLPNAVRLSVALAVMLIAHRVPAPGLTGLLNQGEAATFTSDASGEAVESSEGTRSVFVGPGGGASGPAFASLLQSSLLSSLDIYTVWGLLLTGIGAAATTRLGWLKAGVATLIYWGTSLVLAVLPPLALSGLLSLAGPGGPGPIR